MNDDDDDDDDDNDLRLRRTSVTSNLRSFAGDLRKLAQLF